MKIRFPIVTVLKGRNYFPSEQASGKGRSTLHWLWCRTHSHWEEPLTSCSPCHTSVNQMQCSSWGDHVMQVAPLFRCNVVFSLFSVPFIEPRIVYAHLAVFVLTGVGMGFDYGRRRAAVVHAGQLLHLVYLLMTSDRLGYRQWVMVRDVWDRAAESVQAPNVAVVVLVVVDAEPPPPPVQNDLRPARW